MNSTEVNDTQSTISPSEEYFDSCVAILIPITFSVIALFGVIGNLVVILVIAVNHRQPKNMTNMLIISLAVADLLFIIVCIPFTAARYALPVWPFGSALCKIYQYVAHVTAYASVYTLVLMSLDRFLAVVYPIASITVRTERNTCLAIGANWAIVCISNLHILWEYEPNDYTHLGETRSECLNTRIFTQHKKDEHEHGRIIYGCFFVFAYLLPLTIICTLYGCILSRLTCHSVPGTGRESAERVRNRRRITRMVVVIVLVFTVCWLPIHAVFIALYFGRAKSTALMVSMHVLANCLAYLNSCVNPFLYAFLSDSFRGWFMRMFGCIQTRRPAQLAVLLGGGDQGRDPIADVAGTDGLQPVGRLRSTDDGLQATTQQSLRV